jgi:hypothetical protein
VERNKFLEKLKEEIFRECEDSKYDLQRMAEYYAIFKNTNDKLIEQLLNDCNIHNFVLDYRYDREYCSYGTIGVYLTDDNIKDIEMCEEYYINESYNRLDFHYEIDLNWYEHGSTDEYIPRITINKIWTNDYVEMTFEDNKDSKNIFNEWYEELAELRLKEKRSRLKSIDDNIIRLQKEKEELLKQD